MAGPLKGDGAASLPFAVWRWGIIKKRVPAVEIWPGPIWERCSGCAPRLSDAYLRAKAGGGDGLSARTERALLLDIEIQRKLIRVRAQAHLIDLAPPFEVEPSI